MSLDEMARNRRAETQLKNPNLMDNTAGEIFIAGGLAGKKVKQRWSWDYMKW